MQKGTRAWIIHNPAEQPPGPPWCVTLRCISLEGSILFNILDSEEMCACRVFQTSSVHCAALIEFMHFNRRSAISICTSKWPWVSEWCTPWSATPKGLLGPHEPRPPAKLDRLSHPSPYCRVNVDYALLLVLSYVPQVLGWYCTRTGWLAILYIFGDSFSVCYNRNSFGQQPKGTWKK